MSNYERLSALDAAFLQIETPSCHMHVAMVLTFDAKPLQLDHGGIDIERIRRYFDAGIHYVPRYRQRIELIPLQHHPVWVDDDAFNIRYHVRHTALPRPGTPEQLQEVIARIVSQKLDRARPLWELWFIEGLEDDRFALVGKVHHCMLDGVAGVNVMRVWLSTDPEAVDIEPPQEWTPRPTPTRSELLSDELVRRGEKARALWSNLGKLKEDPQRAFGGLKSAASTLLSTVGANAVPSSRTPLNPARVGAYRRVEPLRFDLDAAKEIARSSAATLNDVVLATIAGGVRGYLRRRGVNTDLLDYRALVPVNLRTPSETRAQKGSDASAKLGGKTLGNRLSSLLVRLPLGEAAPAERMRRVKEASLHAKRSGQRQGGELMEELGDWAFTRLMSRAIRVGGRMRAYSLLVTNIPGPPKPVYLLGACLLEAYPLVPLYLNQALAVALFSYAGKLYWGLNADYDAISDLGELRADLEAEFATLANAGGNGASA